MIDVPGRNNSPYLTVDFPQSCATLDAFVLTAKVFPPKTTTISTLAVNSSSDECIRDSSTTSLYRPVSPPKVFPASVSIPLRPLHCYKLYTAHYRTLCVCVYRIHQPEPQSPPAVVWYFHNLQLSGTVQPGNTQSCDCRRRWDSSGSFPFKQYSQPATYPPNHHGVETVNRAVSRIEMPTDENIYICRVERMWSVSLSLIKKLKTALKNCFIQTNFKEAILNFFVTGT